MKFKYYTTIVTNPANSLAVRVWRRNKIQQDFVLLNREWTKSYNILSDGVYKKISRDEARKLEPAAFKKIKQ